jgi:drug/metabolite transporter (DMT)-like permease
MQKYYTKGIYLALTTAIISGFANFVNKFAVTAITPPLVFTATKNAGVGLLIIAILLITMKWKKLKNLSKREYMYLTLIGIIGGSIPFYLFFTGLAMVPAINASIIQKTLVLWIAILAIPFLKEKLSRWQVIAVVLIFLGNLTIGGFKGFTYSQGEFYILLATMLWAVENILAKKILPTVDPDIVTGARMGLGSLLLLIAAYIVAPHALAKTTHLTQIQWFWMMLTMGTLLGYVMSWYRALKYAPAIVVASVLTVGTVITNILSVIFVTHTWTIDLTSQAMWMGLGISIFWLITRKQEKQLVTEPTK